MTKPNILLITSDQQHWSTLGAVNPEIRTPNLDRLAAQGMRFDRAYCPNPTCTPTRASIITGRYPSQHGAWTLGASLPESETTLGEILADDGYSTALVGKAHFQPLTSTDEHPSIESYPLLHDLDFWRDFTGPFYGFDHVELARNHTSEAHAGQHYALWLEDQGCANWRDYFLPPTGTLDPEVKHRWPIPERFHQDAWIADRSTAMLQGYAEAQQPFFLWASFFDPHPPYLVPEPWDELYDPAELTVPALAPGEHDRNPPHFALTQEERPDFSAWEETGHRIQGFASHRRPSEEARRLVATYYAMVSLMDKYIGVILDKLDELGLAENTLVVFTTDHGHFFGQHGLQAKGPFHYEDLLRVPMIVRHPGVVPAGTTSTAIQSLVDLAPSLLSAAGVPVPRTMTGVNQREVWTGERPIVRDHAITEFHHEPTSLNLRTYIDERYKITMYQGHEYGELFDLVSDPGETANLWDDPDCANLKMDLLLRYIGAELAKEPMWMPRVALA